MPMSLLNDLPTVLFSTFACKQGAVRAVRFNVDGNYCLTCGSDKTVKLWNPHKESGLLLKTYMGHGYEVLDACGSSDNARIVSGGMDKQVIVWDVSTGKILQKYRGHVGCVNAVTLNEDSSVALSASLDGTVKAWDLRSKSRDPIQNLDEATDSVICVAANNTSIISGSADGRVRRYDLREGQMYLDFVGKSVTSINFTKDGQCLLVSTLDSIIRLLDKDTGELLNDFTGHKNNEYKIDSCLISTDDYVISGSEDGKIYIWSLIEGKLVVTLDNPNVASAFFRKPFHSISSHPTKPCLLAANMDKIYLWKTKSDIDDEME